MKNNHNVGVELALSNRKDFGSYTKLKKETAEKQVWRRETVKKT